MYIHYGMNNEFIDYVYRNYCAGQTDQTEGTRIADLVMNFASTMEFVIITFIDRTFMIMFLNNDFSSNIHDY